MATDDEPLQVIVLAGPNGAGKTTAAATVLPAEMPFVNADEVARTLPRYPSREADLEAGRLVLRRFDDLGRQRVAFAVETTLAGRTLAARLSRLRAVGYRFRLVFPWSPGAEFCIGRVASRVRRGGHDIPEQVIRRRYTAGLKNFFVVYRAIADRWEVFDATEVGPPRLVAEGTMGRVERVDQPATWRLMQERAGHVS